LFYPRNSKIFTRGAGPLCLILALCGCTAAGEDRPVELLTSGPGAAAGTSYNLTAPEERDIERTYTAAARIEFPKREALFCEDETRLVAVHTSNYTRVRAGELLAELEYDREAVSAEIAILEIERARAVEEQDIVRREHELALREIDRRVKVEVSYAQRKVFAAMRERELLAFGKAQWEHGNALADLDRELGELNEKLGRVALTAPFDGYATGVTGKKPGDVVPAGEPVLQVLDDNVYQARISGLRENYHYGMPLTIQIPKVGEYTGAIVSDPSELAKADAELVFRVRIDGELPEPYSLNALDMPVEIRTQYVEKALTIPFSCLNSEDDRRYVNIFEDGVVKKRYVKTGLTTRDWAEIIYGLEPGDQVFAG
jgi:hypothetical protein